MERHGLSGNQLKLLAALTMTVDHIGEVLFPTVILLRIIGRLAFPIFAYMIAEGCTHTRNMPRYFGRVAALAVFCQIVYAFAEGRPNFSVLVTFSVSIALIWIIRSAWGKPNGLVWIGFALFVAWVFCSGITLLKPEFLVDYGFFGALLPVLICFPKKRYHKFLAAAAGLTFLCLELGGIQWWSLFSLLPLALYSGERGKWRIPAFFYLYYPLHLAVIWGIGMLLY